MDLTVDTTVPQVTVNVTETNPVVNASLVNFNTPVPGKSAYQSAVDNGFVGTEAEWVASLGGGGTALTSYGTQVASLSDYPLSFPPDSHTHVIADTTGLQGALDSKQPAGDYATNTALTTGLAGKADSTHSHIIADVTGLQAELDGKQVAGDYATNTALTAGLSGKANSVHSHVISDTTGLQTALDGKQAAGDYATNTALTSGLSGKASSVHTHVISDVTNLQTALDGKQAAGSYASAAQGSLADTAVQPADIPDFAGGAPLAAGATVPDDGKIYLRALA